MKFITTLAVSAIALSTASASFSEDFTGLYVGGSFTYVNAEIPKVELKQDSENFNFTGYVGYNFVTSSNIVLGAEAGLIGLGKVQLEEKNNVKKEYTGVSDIRAKIGYAFPEEGYMGYIFGGIAGGKDGDKLATGTVYGLGYDAFAFGNLSFGVEIAKRQFNKLDGKDQKDNFYEDLAVSLRTTYNF